jgi:predicted GNAT family N-acyltransferase
MIQEITAKDTQLLRQLVLRKGKPIDTCVFDGDNLPTTTHFGYYENDCLVGVVSIFKKENNLFKIDHQYQIRGMAVIENHQMKGIGQKLIFACEECVKENLGNLIWFNARINAITFYEKMNYKIIGDSFEIKDIGAHFLMKKRFLID